MNLLALSPSPSRSPSRKGRRTRSRPYHDPGEGGRSLPAFGTAAWLPRHSCLGPGEGAGGGAGARRRISFIFLCLVSLPHLRAADTPELLLEEGLYLESALADPDAAILTYERVLAASPLPPRIAARAQLRMGLCLELLGRLDAARERFEAVASSPGAEAAAVRMARRRLGEALLDEPASFMPADVFVYAELVDPPQRIQELAALLEGTPFENPVDYYATYLGRNDPARRGPPAQGAGDGEVRQAAALFNEGFLRELRKMEGFALAVPGEAGSEREFIAVLFPGSSDIIRGFIRMALTISNATPLGQVRGVPIFETREPPSKEGAAPEQMCYALGREVILFGRPARLLEEAIERHASGSPSLADASAFREARSGDESLLFTFVGHQRLLEVLRREAKPEDRRGLDLMEAVLGTGSLRSLSMTVSWMRSSDSLGLGVRARFAAGLPALWSALATSPSGSGEIPAAPPASPGYLALRVDRGRERWERLRQALAPVIDELEKKGDHGLVLVYQSLAEEPGSRLLDALEALVLGVAEVTSPGGKAEHFASLRLGSRSPAERSGLVEGALAALLGRVFKNRSSEEFADVELPASGTEGSLRARFVEPVPGFRVYHADIRGSDVIAADPDVLLAARAGSSHDLPGPAAGGKALFLRPSAWASAEPEGSPRDLLRDVPRAWITLREEGDAVVAVLQVPEFTTVARSILRRIAETERKRALEENR